MRTAFSPAVCAAALLLSACAGTAVNAPGDGALRTEQRLTLTEGGIDDGTGGGSAARAAAAWGILGTGVGSGTGHTTLVTDAELAALSNARMSEAARNRPRDGRGPRRYLCDDGACGTFDRRDASGLWREVSLGNWSHAFIYADGGVTQSGRGFYSNDDAIAVALDHDSDGDDVAYKVGYTFAPRNARIERWTLDSASPTATFKSVDTKGRVTSTAATVTVNTWTVGDKKGALFRASADDDGDGDADRLWLALTTDIAGADDTDWLATGLWAWTPASGRAEDHRFGVFANGGDPFDLLRFQTARPSGAATYTGDASGVYSRLVSTPAGGGDAVALTVSRANDFFEASATLTADFSTREYGGYGVLQGTIGDFTVDGADVAGNPTLTLRPATIGSAINFAGYHIGGGTQMTFDGASWSGSWGAQFFGNPDTDASTVTDAAGPQPRSVAGTFGAATGAGDSMRTIVGAFGAHR